jgi:hypothetical protein
MLVPVRVKWHHVRGIAVGTWTDGCPLFSVFCSLKICHRTLRNVRTSSKDLSSRNYYLLFRAAGNVRLSPWGKDACYYFECFVRRKCWAGYLDLRLKDWMGVDEIPCLGAFWCLLFIKCCLNKLRTVKWVWLVANIWEDINEFKNFSWKSRIKDNLWDGDVHRTLLLKWILWDCEQDSSGLGYGSLSVCVEPGDKAADCIQDCELYGHVTVDSASCPKGRFTHSMPRPCRAAKGLERVFPIWFTQCGRVWFTLAVPRPCHALTMPFFSRPLNSTAVERRPVGYLPAFGFFRLPRGVPRRLLSEAYQSSSQRSIRTTVRSGSSALQKGRSVKLLD